MFTISGGSRPITQIAKEAFPQSFENNNNFHWDDFPVEVQEYLRNLSNEEAKWKNFPAENCARSTSCETNISVSIDSHTCNKCQELLQERIFNVSYIC